MQVLAGHMVGIGKFSMQGREEGRQERREVGGAQVEGYCRYPLQDVHTLQKKETSFSSISSKLENTD